MRRLLIPFVTAMLAAGVLGPVAAAQASSLRVGSVTLKPCRVVAHAWCGHIVRPWDSTGAVSGSLRVGFAWIPATSGRSVGVVVPHEGGPGYSTTGSAGWFAEMYAGVLGDHDMLLVDQRGTGRTAAIACPALDEGTLPYVRAVGKCARSLGDRAGLYGSAQSADDLAAVLDALGIDRVDMYGDSYGTFFGQVFAGLHPDRLRTLLLDGTYPTYGESAWYPSQGAALRRSFTDVCARSIMCRTGEGKAIPLLGDVLKRLRKQPVTVRAPGGDGRLHRVTLDAAAVAGVAYNATYLSPTYRELTGAIRSALHGDYLPLGRLYSQYFFTGEGPVNPREYSAGAEAAVSCHDYPQLFDLTASRKVRERQYRSAFQRMERSDPGLYGPFTIREYRISGWTSFGMCLRWPKPLPGQQFGPPRPPHGYPDVPTLVLSGELDTITTPAEGATVTRQFPNARQVVVANSLHVVGGNGADSCGARLVRYLVRSGSNDVPAGLLSCAADVPPIRAVRDYPKTWQRTPVPPGTEATSASRLAVTAANTVADLIDQWWQSYSDHGPGLRGGTWRVKGYESVRFHLSGVRLAGDLPVSGTATWNRVTGALRCSLRVPRTSGVHTITGHWNTVTAGATATMRLEDAQNVAFLAP